MISLTEADVEQGALDWLPGPSWMRITVRHPQRDAILPRLVSRELRV